MSILFKRSADDAASLQPSLQFLVQLLVFITFCLEFFKFIDSLQCWIEGSFQAAEIRMSHILTTSVWWANIMRTHMGVMGRSVGKKTPARTQVISTATEILKYNIWNEHITWSARQGNDTIGQTLGHYAGPCAYALIWETTLGGKISDGAKQKCIISWNVCDHWNGNSTQYR